MHVVIICSRKEAKRYDVLILDVRFRSLSEVWQLMLSKTPRNVYAVFKVFFFFIVIFVFFFYIFNMYFIYIYICVKISVFGLQVRRSWSWSWELGP
jgi:hypothetical protein